MNIKKMLILNIIFIILIFILPNKKITRAENIAENITGNITENNIENIVENTPKSTQENIIENAIVSRSITEIRVAPTTYSEEIVEYIKYKEGFHTQAYKNPGETNWTIGYGHCSADVYQGQTISQEEADRLLRAELSGISDYVLNYCEYLKLNQNELDALISFCMNLGNGNLQKLTKNKTRNREEIVEHITAYTGSGSESFRNGLYQRRLEEKDIFLNGNY